MRIILLTVLSAVCFMQTAFSQNYTIFAPPKVEKAVNDYADVIDASTEKVLEEKLNRLRLQTKPSVQIAVVIVKTTGEEPIFDASLATARNWATTSKDSKKHGLLMFIAIDDRKYHTQITRELEPDLPSATLGELQGRLLRPAFRQGQYAKGIEEAIDAIVSHLVTQRNYGWLKVPDSLAKPKYSFNEAKQMILVATPDWNAVQGKLQRFERKSAKGKWQKVGDDVKIVVGRTGLAWGEGLHDASVIQKDQPVKREGDGKSPAGIFELTSAFGTVADTSALKLPYTPLVESTECVDDVKSGKYNLIVDRYKVGDFDWKSSEKMLAVGEQYSLGVFVAHNSYPPQRGKGSCIFLHVWKDANSGTAGCTAMEKENMAEILRWLDKSKTPVLVQLPNTELNRFSKTWKLPDNN